MIKIFNMLKSGKKPEVFIIVVLFFHILVNFYILSNSKLLREGDEITYFKDIVSFPSSFSNTVKDFVNFDGMAHPKFFILVGRFIYYFLKKIGLNDLNSSILYTNGFFLLILFMCVYGIGTMLYNKKAGLFGCILLSFSPIIFSYSRILMLDLPLTAMVFLFFYFLFKTDKFNSFFYSLICGILFAIAQLTKETAVIFILPPLLYFIIKSLVINIERIKYKILNIFVMLLFFVILSMPVYFSSYNKELFEMYSSKSLIQTSRDLFFYLKSFDLYLGLFFLIVAGPLLLNYIVNIKRRNLFLFIYSFCPLLIYSFFPNKAPRFLIPIVPGLFVFLSSEVFNIKYLFLQRIYKLLLIMVLVFQYLWLNFCPTSPRPYHIHEAGLLNIVKNEDFNTAKTIRDFFLKEDLSPHRRYCIIFTFREMQRSLQADFLAINSLFFIECPLDSDIVCAVRPNTVDWKKYLLKADYVVDRTGDIRIRGALEDITTEFQKSLYKHKDIFKKIAVFKRTNGDSIFIYKNTRRLKCAAKI